MKKINTLIVLAGLSFSSFAGEPVNGTNNFLSTSKGDGEKCFDESTHIINFGIGFGGYAYHSLYRGAGYSYARTPLFSLSYEQPWPKKLGPGYLGIGALVAYQHESINYDYNYGYASTSSGFVYTTYHYNHKWNYYMVAARAAYHWDVLNSKNAEVYAGILIGIRFNSETYTTNDPGKNDPYNYQQNFVSPVGSVYAGARWYFAKNFGVYGEVGYGISYATVGLSYKF
jgi:hypothetical protein